MLALENLRIYLHTLVFFFSSIVTVVVLVVKLLSFRVSSTNSKNMYNTSVADKNQISSHHFSLPQS